MAKLAQWEKREILNIYKHDRHVARCVMVSKIEKERDILTVDIDKRITNARNDLKELENKKIDMLEKVSMNNLTPPKYGCNVYREYPELENFDKQTDDFVIKVIRG